MFKQIRFLWEKFWVHRGQKILAKLAMDTITNYWLQQAVIWIIYNEMPWYIFLVPCSSSGKYHPKADQGLGGVIRHIRNTVLIGLEQLRSDYPCIDAPSIRDKFIIAAMFHDTLKDGEKNTGKTVHEHPLLSADWLLNAFKRFEAERGLIPGLTQQDREEIAQAIRTHMGKWTTSVYSNVVLPSPSSPLEHLVHLADYISSRKYHDQLY